MPQIYLLALTVRDLLGVAPLSCLSAGSQAEDGRDSIARQVATEQHWDDLVILIAVVSE